VRPGRDAPGRGRGGAPDAGPLAFVTAEHVVTRRDGSRESFPETRMRVIGRAQAMVRGWSWRRKLSRYVACIRVQAAWRGHAVRAALDARILRTAALLSMAAPHHATLAQELEPIVSRLRVRAPAPSRAVV
jgi:hypothetical protein